jgi:hypothetical protein
LGLVEGSQAVRNYRDRVVANGRELLVIDQRVMIQIVENEDRDKAAFREAVLSKNAAQACRALHSVSSSATLR